MPGPAPTPIPNDEHYGQSTTRLAPAYAAKRAACGTLANGGVYVAVSSIPTPVPILGLFAGRAFRRGEVVTTTGGLVVSELDARQAPLKGRSHMRHVPNSSYVLDGLPWATHIAASAPGLEEALRQRALDARHRAHVVPSPHAAVVAKSGLNDPDLAARICHSGIGYMANTADASDDRKLRNNVTVQRAMVTREPCQYTVVLQASVDIPEGAEILSPYGWNRAMREALMDPEEASASDAAPPVAEAPEAVPVVRACPSASRARSRSPSAMLPLAQRGASAEPAAPAPAPAAAASSSSAVFIPPPRPRAPMVYAQSSPGNPVRVNTPGTVHLTVPPGHRPIFDPIRIRRTLNLVAGATVCAISGEINHVYIPSGATMYANEGIVKQMTVHPGGTLRICDNARVETPIHTWNVVREYNGSDQHQQQHVVPSPLPQSARDHAASA